jgi:hypothetical protein
MPHRFQKHYTREEAGVLLPQIREWLRLINGLREELAKRDIRLESLRSAGADLGGELANDQVKLFADVKELLREFQRREIVIQDFDRGLIDFPALVGGREVFLCWEQDEETVEFWHDLDTGFAGRERL